MSIQVVIARTGVANIGSISAAFRRAGASITITEDPQTIASASHLIVPGVGSFGAAMDLVTNNGCAPAITERIKKGLPTFLVCLGMQILGTSGEESPGATGLSIIDAPVTRFSPTTEHPHLIIPQQGWNKVFASPSSNFLVDGFAYFSNSYKFDNVSKDWSSSVSYYGRCFVAAAERGAVLACQFHPELSGSWGFSVIQNWLAKSAGLIASVPAPSDIPERQLTNNKAIRIVPCLDVKGGKVVKGIKFQNIKEAGDPVECASNYETQGADELVVLDISATLEDRKTTATVVQQVRNVLSIPLCVGGGVKTIDDVARLLEVGADKVAVNTAAVKNPSILNEMAQKFGRQCTVLSIDAMQVTSDTGVKSWEVVISAGKERTGIDVVTWAKEGQSRGAGEILLTSWDRDGTKSGYDTDLLAAVSAAVDIPIVASGGAATAEHMVEAVQQGVDAVLAASIFHYQEYTVGSLKQALSDKGISVRL